MKTETVFVFKSETASERELRIKKWKVIDEITDILTRYKYTEEGKTEINKAKEILIQWL